MVNVRGMPISATISCMVSMCHGQQMRMPGRGRIALVTSTGTSRAGPPGRHYRPAAVGTRRVWVGTRGRGREGSKQWSCDCQHYELGRAPLGGNERRVFPWLWSQFYQLLVQKKGRFSSPARRAGDEKVLGYGPK